VDAVFVVANGLSNGVYAATNNGLYISADSGATWANIPSANVGPGVSAINGISVVGVGASAAIYAATNNGVWISQNGGASWAESPDIAGNACNAVYVIGSGGTAAVFAASINDGVLVSLNGGNNWTPYNNATSGLPNNLVYSLFAVGSSAPYTIYAGTAAGVEISTTGGTSWMNYPFTGSSSGPASNTIQGIYVNGTTIYAATNAGLSISSDSGTTWATSAVASSNVLSVYVSGSTIYASTAAGLSVSPDGVNWQTFTTANGLGSNLVNGVVVQ
jgi:hypothetical protein